MSETVIPERRARRSVWTAWQDETGAWSTSRLLLTGWLLNAACYVWRHDQATDESIGVVLTFFTGIAVPLIIWAGGPRLAQYLAPVASGVVQSVADAAKALAAKIQARRNPEQGFEVQK